jgi:hypothetical protein
MGLDRKLAHQGNKAETLHLKAEQLCVRQAILQITRDPQHTLVVVEAGHRQSP